MYTVLLRGAALALVSVGFAGCTVAPRTEAAKAGPEVAQGSTHEGCVAKLSPEAGLVYRASALDMRHDTDMPTLLRERVMMLVFTGRLERDAARPAAEQAAVCLEQLRH